MMNKQIDHSDKHRAPLKDSFNRRIDYLRISITDKCNLKCVYCTPVKAVKRFSTDDLLTDEEIVRFVKSASRHGLRKVRITGGEPLMRKSIITLTESLKQAGITDLSLTTNGTLLPDMAADLRKAGLDRVNISLDTLDRERYRGITRGGNIRRVWKAIESAEKTGLVPVKINVVPIRGLNDDEIPRFASLTYDHDYHVRFIEFMPAVNDGTWTKDKYIRSDAVLKQISGLGQLTPLPFRGSGPSRNFRLSGARGVIGIISPLSDHFCSHCNRLRLTSDGRLRPCLFSPHEVDIRTPMRSGISDTDLDRLFCKAVQMKPTGHSLSENPSRPPFLESMSKIGG
jgi:cyclic pyranopterin phosphate synthase